jgi:hypothetical protein
MHCDKALIRPPPPTLFLSTNVTYDPPKAYGKDERKTEVSGTISSWQAKREQFMLCHLIRAVNEAVSHHKSMACRKSYPTSDQKGEGANTSVYEIVANLSEVYSVFDDPTNY